MNQIKTICTEFKVLLSEKNKHKQQSMVIVIDDLSDQFRNLDDAANEKHKKCIQKILKALESGKESKCRYILKSQTNLFDDSAEFYHFNLDTYESKEAIQSDYKTIYQNHSGFSESDWFQENNNSDYQATSSSEHEDDSNSSKKRHVRTMIDVNKYRLSENQNNKEKIYYKIHVGGVQSDDTQPPTHIQEIQKNRFDDHQGISDDLNSSAQVSVLKESQSTIQERDNNRFLFNSRSGIIEKQDPNKNIIKQEEEGMYPVSAPTAQHLMRAPQNIPEQIDQNQQSGQPQQTQSPQTTQIQQLDPNQIVNNPPSYQTQYPQQPIYMYPSQHYPMSANMAQLQYPPMFAQYPPQYPPQYFIQPFPQSIQYYNPNQNQQQ